MAEQVDNLDTPNARVDGPLSPLQRHRRQQRFLAAYRESANIKHSCKVAGVSRQTFYDWRDHDQEFRVQLPDAEREADDTLEYAAHERAVHGVPSYVVSQGKLVYGPDKKPLIERKYSDTLAITLLKARMPEKYKDRSVQEHSGSIKLEHSVDYSRFSDEELAQLEELAHKAVERGSS